MDRGGGAGVNEIVDGALTLSLAADLPALWRESRVWVVSKTTTGAVPWRELKVWVASKIDPQILWRLSLPLSLPKWARDDHLRVSCDADRLHKSRRSCRILALALGGVGC